MECYVVVYLIALVRTGKGGPVDVGLQAGLGFGLGNCHLEEWKCGIFPYLGVGGSEGRPIARVVRIDPRSREGGDGMQSCRH